MKLNQKGFNDTITITILGGIIGALFITSVFVWKEIDKVNTINILNYKIFHDLGKTDIDYKDSKKIINYTRLEVKAPFSIATIDVYKDRISYNAESGLFADIYDGGGPINMSEVDKLNNYINQIDFWSFKDKYISNDLMDATYYTITVMSCGNKECGPLDDPSKKSVTCYGQCPDEIQVLINNIKELWGQDILEVGV